MPAILEAAAEAGATSAGYVPLRLPHGVKELFADWIQRAYPDRAERVLNRVRELRGGQLYDSTWHTRGTGEGVYAEHIRTLFETSRRRYGYDERGRERYELSTASFRAPAPPPPAPGELPVQLGLFDQR